MDRRGARGGASCASTPTSTTSSPVDTRRLAARSPAGRRARGAGASSRALRRRLRARALRRRHRPAGPHQERGPRPRRTRRAAPRSASPPPHCRERLSALFTNRRVTPPPSARARGRPVPALLRPLGIAPAPPSSFTCPSAPAAPTRRMDEFLVEPASSRATALVALNPGAGRADKRWPVDALRRASRERLAARGGRPRAPALGARTRTHLARADPRRARRARAMLAPPTDLDELAAPAAPRARSWWPPTRGRCTWPPRSARRASASTARRPPRATAPTGARHRALQSPDGTHGRARRRTRCSRRRSELLDARDGARVSRLSRHDHRVERGGAPPRVPRERGLGRRDRRGRRGVAATRRRRSRASSPITSSVRPWPGFAAQKNFAHRAGDAATGSSRSTPTSA